MGRRSDNPLRFVVSCRLNHEEISFLQGRADKYGISLSTLVRNCLELPDPRQRVAKQN